jgi:tetratricopeptide (TPR) repeat protein
MHATDIASTLVHQLRRCIVWCAALALVCSAAAGEFEDANRLYDEGQFAEAKQNYEQLVARGEWTPNVFYNLGNTDYRLGANGPAMLDYERALALDPAHPEARRNLELLRERAGSRVVPRRWFDRLFPSWTANAFALVCTVAGWTAVFCFALLFVGRTRRPARGWLGALAICIALYSGAGVWHADQKRSLAIITVKEAVARLAPAVQSDIAGTLPAGSQVRVLTERGDWVYCDLPGEGLGWLPAEVLERVQIRT